jgi:hypothetical protein
MGLPVARLNNGDHDSKLPFIFARYRNLNDCRGIAMRAK